MPTPEFQTEDYLIDYPQRRFDSPEDGKELFIPSRPAQQVQSNYQVDPTDQRLQESEAPINPVNSAMVSERKLSPEEKIMKRFLSTREEAPKIDQDKIDRLRRMGRINQFGRGVGILGDALSLGLGANVRRKAPDQISPALYQSYENVLDKHDQENKAFKYRDYQRKLSDIQFGIARLDKETEREYRNRVQAANEAFRKVKNAQDLAKWQAEFKIKQKQQDIDEEYKKTLGKAALIRANKTGSENKADRPKIIQTKNATHNISPAEYSFRRERALKNSELLKTRFKNMFIDTPKLNKYNKPIPGQFVTSLSPDIKDDDLVRADIEMEENSTTPSPEVLKQNEQKSAPNATKPDPLGLFHNNQLEENHVTQKVDYSKKVPSFFQENPYNLKGVPKGGF